MTAAPSGNGNRGDGLRLFVPKGWALSDLVAARLRRQLERAPAHVTAVVAALGDLLPASSYRSQAEHLVVEPMTSVSEVPAGALLGAAVVRPGVRCKLEDDVLTIAKGPILLDHGTQVHDPWRPVTPLLPATILGRPLFSWRPVVLFLSCDREPDGLEWARPLANELLRRDVEARLAGFEVPEGLHLSRPCLASEESVRALAPDVIVALDGRAVVAAEEWSADLRSTVVIEATDDLTDREELVPWRIGKSSGRLRARIGRRMPAERLALLVNRLCSGPQPAPPRLVNLETAGDRPVAMPRAAGRKRPLIRIVALAGVVDHVGELRIEGLLDHVVACGHGAERRPLSKESVADIEADDVVVLRGVSHHRDTQAVLRELAARRALAIIDVAPGDVARGGADLDEPVELLPEAAALVERCGVAISASRRVHEALQQLGVRSMWLPSLLERQRAGTLKRLRAQRQPQKCRALAWSVGRPGVEPAPWLAQVAEAVAALLDEEPWLELQLIGDPRQMPDAALRHARSAAARAEIGPDVLVGCVAQLWTPHDAATELAGELTGLVDASYLGVPSVVSSTNHAVPTRRADASLAVDEPNDPQQWFETLRTLLDPDEQAERSRMAINRIESFFGGRASAMAVGRFVGFVLHARESR